MYLYLYILLLITLIFSNPNTLDSNIVIIPEIEVYGGLNENNINSNVLVITKDKFYLNDKKHF